jgi:signal transduction histidine kinase
VSVIAADAEVTVEVRDDGGGFDPSSTSGGFGLAGMRERVYLAGGTLRLESSKQGTLVSARLANPRSAQASAQTG